MVRSSALLATSLLVIGLLTGCAERSGTDEKSGGEGAFPVTVAPKGGKKVTIDSEPKRIVSLSASNTETLYAVGAGDQVVAVDEMSTYPEDAPKTKLSGFTPNVEAITKYKPDLVVISDDMNGIVKSLDKVKTPVLHVPAAKTLDDLYESIELIGEATGHADEGADLAERTEQDVHKVAKDAAVPGKKLSYYHELDQELNSATSQTFVGEIYRKFGLRNVADKADKDKSGYPQLSAEYVVKQNPDLVFLADVKCCGQNAKTVAKRPGWKALDAVKNGNVVELDDDLASRWGPRVVDLARDVADAVEKAAKDA